MQLLVSVKSAVEAASALAGGADIIDAKDPSRGSLGPVARDELAAILACVPEENSFSVVLGDVATVDQVSDAIASIRLSSRTVFVKLGLAGIRSPALAGRLLEVAVASAAKHTANLRVVAVTYADSEPARTVPPHELIEPAAEAGCTGVLLDTYRKDGPGVLQSLPAGAVASWLASAHTLGLLTAIAGGLSASDFPAVSALAPAIVGVRGAACEGGRNGLVSVERVRALRDLLGTTTLQAMGGLT
jgi:(5-formylfuran-3-yl)methyl phosphate synthase